MNKKIIIDEENDWRAFIWVLDSVVSLGFETKPSGFPIQGYVDDALDGVYDCETEIGIDDLTMIPDDGFCIVDYANCPQEQRDEIVPKIIDFLTDVYNENKKRFAKCIKRDLKDYDKL